MIEFKRVTGITDIKKIEKYIKNLDSHFSTLNLPGFLMWRNLYPRDYCIFNDTLIIKELNPDGRFKSHFFMPLGSDIPGALEEIENYCRKSNLPLVFANLTEDEAASLSQRYSCADIFYDRSWSDYIYLAEDMRTFAGKKFSGQRNHINKFKKLYGDYIYNEINDSNKAAVKEFLIRFGQERDFSSPTEEEEFRKVLELMENLEHFDIFGGFVEVGGNIVAMSMGLSRGDMLFVTVEKADRNYEGSYQVMVQEFARHHTDENIIYINREDDMGLEGLRKSKLQYKPVEIKHKYYLYAQTLFDSINAETDISTERIALNDITQDDAESFFRLCSDTDNNKYWGYDCREDSQYTNTPVYFLNFVRKMKDTKEEYSFAVRYEGKLAGELVFHNFDYRGGLEIGIRLLPEFQGKGLGSEAVKLASEYAKAIGAKEITMKCFKENIPSYNMIKKAGFKEIRTDDTHIHFVL